ncbi:MAG: GH116 family glycosyl hydrolase [Candidatus Omnitrophica bacterium]|nr:GH116 family glycosyl hydrolase [Candidatus Omnitrophota bacterium]
MTITYTSKDHVTSGLPLGGLGCGTLQIFPDGTRGVFTGMNNWENPLGILHWFRRGAGGEYRNSNPFALYVKNGRTTTAKFLQTIPLDNCPTVRKILFSGAFPFADLDFVDDDFDVKISLKAWFPFSKKEYRDSALPVAVYTFSIKNTASRNIDVALMASAFNPVGRWNVGRYNEVFRKKGLAGVNFRKEHCHPRDESDGVITLSTDSRERVSYFGEWNYVRENFRGNQDDRNFEAWKYFSRDGTLPDTNAKSRTLGEGDEWMAALSVKTTLRPGAVQEINFYYTWYMPKHYLGHIYENWFGNSADVAVYVSKNRSRLMKRSAGCRDAIVNSPLAPWLKDGLMNCLSVMTAASWWTKKNIFVMYENPVKWPLMDSLDVRYYGTVPLLLYFPDLEKNTMRLFRDRQRPDGRIVHDLGRGQIECPSDGTTAGRPWKDLSTKYALMVYRDYYWTGDKKFLKEMYPSVKKAMSWEFATDKDGNGLPDNEGKDQTYDLWEFHGTGSYTSGIFLAALLACIKMADAMKDKKFARLCRDHFDRGQKSFEEELWSGTYYIAGRSPDTVYDACIASQLNGQWYAHLLGLGYIVDRKRVRQAVKTIIRLNGNVSKYGVVNSVYPDGRIDRSSYHAENIWAGESYAFASLAVYEGFINDGLRLARMTWSNFVENARNIWYQPDVVLAKDGAMGDGELYVRNLSLWTVPFALARHDKKVRKFLLKIEPTLPI